MIALRGRTYWINRARDMYAVSARMVTIFRNIAITPEVRTRALRAHRQAIDTAAGFEELALDCEQKGIP